MGEGIVRQVMDTCDLIPSSSIQNSSIEPLDDENEYEGGEGTTLSKASLWLDEREGKTVHQ